MKKIIFLINLHFQIVLRNIRYSDPLYSIIHQFALNISSPMLEQTCNAYSLSNNNSTFLSYFCQTH